MYGGPTRIKWTRLSPALSINPLNPKGDQNQFSPNNNHYKIKKKSYEN